jgi:hypothetical protein
MRSLVAINSIITEACPAGLTAAFKLLTNSDIVPIVIEGITYTGHLKEC